MSSRLAWMAILILALTTAGCEGGRSRPPPTSLQVVNVAPALDSLDFLRVQQVAATLAFKNSATIRFDSDTYRLSARVFPPGQQMPETLWSATRELRHDRHYTFVFTEIGGLVEPIIIEEPSLDRTQSLSHVRAVHAGPGIPAVDVYLEPGAADISTATPFATLGFTQYSEARNLAAGTYRLTLTAPGDSGTVLLRSGLFEIRAGEPVLLVVVSEGGTGLYDLSALLLGDQPQPLFDTNLEGGIRVINAVSDRAPRDAYLGDDFSAPALADIEFGTASEYLITASGANQTSITPAGNQGVIELEQTTAIAPGRLHTLLVTGNPGELIATFTTDDYRGLFNQGLIRIANGNTQFGAVEVFVVPPGANPAEFQSVLGLPPAIFSSAFGVGPGDYDVYLREIEVNGDVFLPTENFVAGPFSLSVQARNIYQLLAIDGPDTDTAELVLLERLN
jgi:hypothetical protein